jgi:hypothetical protein
LEISVAIEKQQGIPAMMHENALAHGVRKAGLDVDSYNIEERSGSPRGEQP